MEAGRQRGQLNVRRAGLSQSLEIDLIHLNLFPHTRHGRLTL
jgi:hypothetical protein